MYAEIPVPPPGISVAPQECIVGIHRPLNHLQYQMTSMKFFPSCSFSAVKAVEV